MIAAQERSERIVASLLNEAVSYRDRQPSNRPDAITVQLKRLAHDGTQWVIVDAHTLTGVPTLIPHRPTKFAKLDSTGLSLLAHAVVGEGDGALAPDAALYKAATEYANEARLHPEEARTLSHAVALLVTARAGLAIKRHELRF